MKNTIFGKAKIIDGDSLNRRIYQAVGAFSPHPPEAKIISGSSFPVIFLSTLNRI